METQLETKAGVPASDDPFTALNETFAAFREANDERLAQIERKMGADVVTEEKVERISRRLDDIQLRAAEPGAAPAIADDERKSAFDAYMRRGDETPLREWEVKAHSAGSDPDGGVLVPDEISAEIGRHMRDVSPIRAIAQVVEVSAATFKKPFAQSGPAVGWVGETDARPQTATSQLAELTFPTAELYAMPAATQVLLDDAAVDVDQWIVSEVRQAFAEQETAAFVHGDGVNKPRGFLAEATVDEASWSWGSIGEVASGASGAIDDPDALVDLVYALKSGYRQNACFVMNRSVQAEVRKLKDADGNYIWAPPATADAEARLMGFPVVEVEDMPDAGADTRSIAFGDFRRGYLVVDRQGVSVLRDPYSAKPYVLFYTVKRVGGGVQDFDAIKLMRFGA